MAGETPAASRPALPASASTRPPRRPPPRFASAQPFARACATRCHASRASRRPGVAIRPPRPPPIRPQRAPPPRDPTARPVAVATSRRTPTTGAGKVPLFLPARSTTPRGRNSAGASPAKAANSPTYRHRATCPASRKIALQTARTAAWPRRQTRKATVPLIGTLLRDSRDPVDLREQ